MSRFLSALRPNSAPELTFAVLMPPVYLASKGVGALWNSSARPASTAPTRMAEPDPYQEPAGP